MWNWLDRILGDDEQPTVTPEPPRERPLDNQIVPDDKPSELDAWNTKPTLWNTGASNVDW